jgi:hypothetical protein
MFRQNEALVVHAGALEGRSKNLVLVIERNNVEIREIGSIHCDERNGLIELYGIMPNGPGGRAARGESASTPKLVQADGDERAEQDHGPREVEPE